MRVLRCMAIGVALIAAEIVLAQTVPWHSPFPRARPAHIGLSGSAPALAPVPSTDAAVAQALAGGAIQPGSALAPGRSLTPRVRPPAAAARFARLRDQRPVRTAAVAPSRGGLCGLSVLTGQHVASIPGRVRGCGVENPVRITAVHGIALSQPATIHCDTARAFATWVDRALVPAVGRRGGGIDRISVAASYACRPRNNRPGARISEHGRGMAIDISGYRLRDGTVVTLLRDWRRRPHRSDLREAYEGACGIFTTTLGPGSDRNHQDHFHFDLQRHRNGGTYCR